MTEADIRRHLGAVRTVGRELRCYPSLGSTNDRAKELALEGAADGTVVTADCQTAGRGRRGRSFQSPRDQGLYLSVLLRPQLMPERLTAVTSLAGVAVCRSVERVCGLETGLKWPNDPVLNGKKLCGILTELTSGGGDRQCLVTGIGVNVSQRQEDFDPEIVHMATSLLMGSGREVSRPVLAAALIEELDRAWQALLSGDLEDFLAEYRRRCVNPGKAVRLLSPNGEETGEALSVDGDFGLVVRLSDGSVRTVRSGEVSVRGLYGYLD